MSPELNNFIEKVKNYAFKNINQKNKPFPLPHKKTQKEIKYKRKNTHCAELDI